MLTEKIIYRILTFLILSIFFIDYLSIKLHLIPRIVTMLPDFFSMMIMLFLFIIFAVYKKINLNRKYLFCFALFIFHLAMGAVFNGVSPGPIGIGIRTYLRYFPFFFLPAIVHFSEKVMNRYLKLFLYLSFLQVPMTLYQRFIQFKGVQTGDVVTGTLNHPSIMSIFMLSVICFLLAMYVRKKIALGSCILFSTILFIPCTINETKAVIILLPIAVLAINFFSQGKDSKFRRFVVIPSILVLLISIFVPIYDHFIQPKWGYGIVEFITKEGRVEGYLYQGATGEEGDVKGRIDSINLALQYISRNPLTFVFGLGMGNLTQGHFKPLRGEYADFEKFGAHITTFGNLLWETGTGGALIFILFLVMIYFDSVSLKRATGTRGDIALSFIGIITILILSLFYKNILYHNISFILWFFLGYVASENFLYTEETSFESSNNIKNIG